MTAPRIQTAADLLNCRTCNALFHPRRNTSKYCSRKCRDRSGEPRKTRNPFMTAFLEMNIGKAGCWEYTSARDNDGYCMYHRIGTDIRRAHREAFRLAIGSPVGISVLHHCDNPPCCNPAHLYAGNQKLNMEDKKIRGRNPIGEKTWNSKLTEQQAVAIIKDGRPLSAIAAECGVSKSTVWLIKKRRAWRHL